MKHAFCGIALNLGFVALAGLQTANAQTVVAHHSGKNQPEDEGFSRVQEGNGGTREGITDGGTAAWHMKFLEDPAYNDRQYGYTMSSATAQQARTNGYHWIGSLRLPPALNLQGTNNDSMILGVHDGAKCYYLNFGADPNGNAVVGAMGGSGGGTWTISGGAVYHTYEIRVAAGATTASVYVDSVLKASGWTGIAYTPTPGAYFGSWSGAGPNEAYWASTIFTINGVSPSFAQHTGAADPATEGFTQTTQGNGGIVEGLVDGGMDTWHLYYPNNPAYNDAYYRVGMDSTTATLARTQGYCLSGKIRVPGTSRTPNDSMILGSYDNFHCYYLNFGTDASGNPIVKAVDGTGGGTWTITGTGYHLYEIRVAPSASVASVYVDGVLKTSNWTGTTFVPSTPGAYFGSWSGAAPNEACFADVQFMIAPTSRGRQIVLSKGVILGGMCRSPVTGQDFADLFNGVHYNLFDGCISHWRLEEPRWAGVNVGAWDANGLFYQGGTRHWPEGEPKPEAQYLPTYASQLLSYNYIDADSLPVPMSSAYMNRLGSDFQRARSNFPNALVYTDACGANVNTGGGVEAGLRTYMRTAQPDMLTTYSYPSWDNFNHWVDGSTPGGFRNNWCSRSVFYSTMATWRKVALEGIDGTGYRPLPYGQWMSMFRDFSYALPAESYVRMERFANLTWGFQFLTDFTFWGYGGTSFFTDGNYTTTTAVYGYAASANAEINNLSNALKRLVSTDARIILGKDSQGQLGLPSGVTAWSNTAGGCSYITSMTPRGKANVTSPSTYCDWIIGYFKPLKVDNSSDYPFANGLHFMVTNGAWQNTSVASAEWIRMEFNFTGTNFNKLQRINRTSGATEIINLTSLGSNRYRLDLKLNGGTGDLFRFYPQ